MAGGHKGLPFTQLVLFFPWFVVTLNFMLHWKYSSRDARLIDFYSEQTYNRLVLDDDKIHTSIEEGSQLDTMEQNYIDFVLGGEKIPTSIGKGSQLEMVDERHETKQKQESRVNIETDLSSCSEERSDLVETYGRKIGRKLEELANKNLCLSFNQMAKFSKARKKLFWWVQSLPKETKRSLLFGSKHQNNYAVVLNDEYAYLHVFKNGGTTVNRLTKSGHTKNKDLGNRKLFTTVRDPIEHFLSGWAECGFRSENPDKDPSFTLDVGIDERIQSWVNCVRNYAHGRKDLCTPCAKHSYPQANFMLKPGNEKWLHPNLEMVGSLKELGGMLEMAGFKGDYIDSKSARTASGNSVKVERYPNDVSLLSGETLQHICGFVKLDYILFDFEPPLACLQQVNSIVEMVEKHNSSVRKKKETRESNS